MTVIAEPSMNALERMGARPGLGLARGMRGIEWDLIALDWREAGAGTRMHLVALCTTVTRTPAAAWRR
jgi:hypothetical protein